MKNLNIMQIPNFSNYAVTDTSVLVRNVRCTGGACGNSAQHYRVHRTNQWILVYEMFDDGGRRHYLDFDEVTALAN